MIVFSSCLLGPVEDGTVAYKTKANGRVYISVLPEKAAAKA